MVYRPSEPIIMSSPAKKISRERQLPLTKQKFNWKDYCSDHTLNGGSIGDEFDEVRESFQWYFKEHDPDHPGWSGNCKDHLEAQEFSFPMSKLVNSTYNHIPIARLACQFKYTKEVKIPTMGTGFNVLIFNTGIDDYEPAWACFPLYIDRCVEAGYTEEDFNKVEDLMPFKGGAFSKAAVAFMALSFRSEADRANIEYALSNHPSIWIIGPCLVPNNSTAHRIIGGCTFTPTKDGTFVEYIRAFRGEESVLGWNIPTNWGREKVGDLLFTPPLNPLRKNGSVRTHGCRLGPFMLSLLQKLPGEKPPGVVGQGVARHALRSSHLYLQSNLRSYCFVIFLNYGFRYIDPEKLNGQEWPPEYPECPQEGREAFPGMVGMLCSKNGSAYIAGAQDPDMRALALLHYLPEIFPSAVVYEAATHPNLDQWMFTMSIPRPRRNFSGVGSSIIKERGQALSWEGSIIPDLPTGPPCEVTRLNAGMERQPPLSSETGRACNYFDPPGNTITIEPVEGGSLYSAVLTAWYGCRPQRFQPLDLQNVIAAFVARLRLLSPWDPNLSDGDLLKYLQSTYLSPRVQKAICRLNPVFKNTVNGVDRTQQLVDVESSLLESNVGSVNLEVAFSCLDCLLGNPTEKWGYHTNEKTAQPPIYLGIFKVSKVNALLITSYREIGYPSPDWNTEEYQEYALLETSDGRFDVLRMTGSRGDPPQNDCIDTTKEAEKKGASGEDNLEEALDNSSAATKKGASGNNEAQDDWDGSGAEEDGVQPQQRTSMKKDPILEAIERYPDANGAALDEEGDKIYPSPIPDAVFYFRGREVQKESRYDTLYWVNEDVANVGNPATSRHGPGYTHFSFGRSILYNRVRYRIPSTNGHWFARKLVAKKPVIHEVTVGWMVENVGKPNMTKMLKDIYKEAKSRTDGFGRFFPRPDGEARVHQSGVLYGAERCFLQRTHYLQGNRDLCRVAGLCSALHASGEVAVAEALWEGARQECKFEKGESMTLAEFGRCIDRYVRGWKLSKIPCVHPVRSDPLHSLFQTDLRKCIFSVGVRDTNCGGHHSVGIYDGKIYDSNEKWPFIISQAALDVVAGSGPGGFGKFSASSYVLERRTKRRYIPNDLEHGGLSKKQKLGS